MRCRQKCLAGLTQCDSFAKKLPKRSLTSCLQQRNLSTSSHLRRHQSEDESKIQFFEQDHLRSASRRPISPEVADVGLDVATEARKLREQIAKDKADVEDIGRQIKDGSVFESAIRYLPAHERSKYRSAIELVKAQEIQKTQAVNTLFPIIAVEVLGTDRQQTKQAKRLNTALKQILEEGWSNKTRSDLWKAYLRCKAYQPQIINGMSDATWSVLLNISALSQMKNSRYWAAHRLQIYDDLLLSGKTPNSSQRLLYVDALNQKGHSEQALRVWEEMKTQVQHDNVARARHQLMGMSIHVSIGTMDQAEQLALQYLDSQPPTECRILIGIVAGWLSRNTEMGDRRAWAVYLRLKLKLDKKISMQDYDHITTTFLNEGRTDFALAVFKDMMLTGQSTTMGSLELYKRAKGVMDQLDGEQIDLQDLNQVAVTGLTNLPRRFQNKFFYGSWLKKLLGMKNIDGASQVLRMMSERGINPDPKYVNGIIGAMLRSDNEKYYAEAERMAWAMILNRQGFVERRQGQSATQSKVNVPQTVLDPSQVRNIVPMGNIETFSLLAFYYVNRKMLSSIDALQVALSVCQIQPDRYYKNHLLFGHLLQGSLELVWQEYKQSYSEFNADVETFECLWDAEKKHLERALLQIPDNFPGPRLILQEMVSWFTSQLPRNQSTYRYNFTRALYEKIIRCMCLANDFEGLIVAAHWLKNSFGVYPDAATAKAVTLAFARTSLDNESGEAPEWKPRRHRERGNKPLKAKTDSIIKIHKSLWQERRRTMSDYGLEDGDLNTEILEEENLFVFTNFLKIVVEDIKPEGALAITDNNLLQIARGLGVGGMDLRDPLRKVLVSPSARSRTTGFLDGLFRSKGQLDVASG